jgi:hypothetical protein
MIFIAKIGCKGYIISIGHAWFFSSAAGAFDDPGETDFPSPPLVFVAK